MKLLFRQRFFSWFDSYDIYDELGNTIFVVKGKLSWGHRLEIYDRTGNYLGQVKERVMSLMPRFELHQGSNYIGQISKKFTFFSQDYRLEYNGWSVDGNMMGWDYQVCDERGSHVAQISKKLFRMTDTYELDILNPDHALTILMIVLAIDAANCSQKNNG